MKTSLKIEEAAQIALSIVLFNQLPFAWWWFPTLFLLPDLSMIGYVSNPRTGAFFYNLFHHKAVAALTGLLGWWLQQPLLTLIGIILFGHTALDRMMGYGLKYPDSFQHTHLGMIGNPKKVD